MDYLYLIYTKKKKKEKKTRKKRNLLIGSIKHIVFSTLISIEEEGAESVLGYPVLKHTSLLKNLSFYVLQFCYLLAFKNMDLIFVMDLNFMKIKYLTHYQ